MKNHYILFPLMIVVSLVLLHQVVQRSLVTQQPKATTDPDSQMVDFLQRYIRINTAHPHPDYKGASSFLMREARKDGFTAQEITLSSGYPVVIITYEGNDPSLPSIALNHHMDVVPATNIQDWITPPFAAEIRDGSIIGRGTQDMKGIGVVQYHALKALKDAGLRPRRTVHLLAVPEEEVGGFKGTKLLVQTEAFKKLNIGTVIDEGVASDDEKQLLIKLTERRPIQIEVTARGQLAHGSHLACQNAAHDLIEFLESLVKLHKHSQLTAKKFHPGMLPSYNVTSLAAGSTATLNVVPACATATVDIRVPPGMSLQEVKDYLDENMKVYPDIKYAIKAIATEESILGLEESSLYKKLEEVCHKHGMTVAPHHFEASSDLRFYHALGIEGVGLTPFTCKENLHGTNESVPIKNLIQGRDILLDFLKSQ
ncbi:hypothetical protein A3F06_02530 [candidate division TM6 bacterium RIFCSPHIGHO2_12_FULL_36_22]|nr:MAG: hypothetical protein A3F06_02530 [candidate division TM6 bacterium RIFCSPHIGHO2_12_FULL_36_22]